ncbi:MAG: ThiF family adenylyltransferase [Candidatus Helarchaeota archaeon]
MKRSKEFFETQRSIIRWNQKLLKKTHVVVVGVGGIGSIAALACTRLGIGKLTLIDCDVVEPSNLNRQILYSIQQIGHRKISSALKVLRSSHALISQVEGADFDIFQNWQRFCKIIKTADFVYNALDLPEVKKLAVANLCLRFRKPMIFAGTDPINGHALMVIFQNPEGRPCFNCLTDAISTIQKDYQHLLELEELAVQPILPIDSMTKTSEISGKTTIYTAAIATMLGMDLMVHWLLHWKENLPNRIIFDLYNFVYESWKETGSCKFCKP